jgi:hypothetical protein
LYEFGFIGILALIMSLVTRITEWGAKFILFIIIGWFVPTLIIYLKNRKTQSDTITINAILSNSFFQKVNLTFGNGSKICSDNNCDYKFEKLLFNDGLEGITSKYLSGILKIEDKSNSKGDIISYNYYQLYGRFNRI